MTNETKRSQSTTDKLIDAVTDKFVQIRKAPLDERLAQLSPEQKIQLQEIEDFT